MSSAIISSKASKSEGKFVVSIKCDVHQAVEIAGIKISELRTEYYTFMSDAHYEESQLPIDLGTFVPDPKFVVTTQFTMDDGRVGTTNWVQIVDALVHYDAILKKTVKAKDAVGTSDDSNVDLEPDLDEELNK